MKILVPLNGRIFVRPIVPKKDGKLLTGKEEHPTSGIVVATHNGYQSPLGIQIEPSVRKGDLVFFTLYSGVDVEFEGEVLKMIMENELTHSITESDDDDEEYSDDYEETDFPDGTMIEEQ